MITFQSGPIMPLPCDLSNIESIAYNGCGYGLLEAQRCGITRLDKTLCFEGRSPTVRRYTTLCFDEGNNCYWASGQGDCSLLWRLNPSFEETGCLCLSGTRICQLQGMSWDPQGSALWLLFPHGVSRLELFTGACKTFPQQFPAQTNLGILALLEGFLVAYLENNCQALRAECPGCGNSKAFPISQEYHLKALLFSKICPGDYGDCVKHLVRLLLLYRDTGDLHTQDLLVTCHKEKPCSQCYQGDPSC